jgi:selenocysteine lyase/cysteine desulfurase
MGDGEMKRINIFLSRLQFLKLRMPVKITSGYLKIIFLTSPVSLFLLLIFTVLLYSFKLSHGSLYTPNILKIFWEDDFFFLHRLFSFLFFVSFSLVIVPTYSFFAGNYKLYSHLVVTKYDRIILFLMICSPFILFLISLWALPGFLIFLSSKGYASVPNAAITFLLGPIAGIFTLVGTSISQIIRKNVLPTGENSIVRYTYMRPSNNPVVNLDVGAFSPRLKVVEDELKIWHSLVNKSAPTSKNVWQYTQGVNDNIPKNWLRKTERLMWKGVQDLRLKIANLVGSDKQNIIFVSSTTRAIQIAIETLEPKGKNIVTTNFEHPTEKRLLEAASKKYGANIFVVEVKSIGDSIDDWERNFIERFVNKCTDEQASLVLISHVCYGNGLILPIEKICVELLKKLPNIDIIIDGAHAAGHIDIDLSSLRCKFYAFGGHKWLFSSINIGILVASDSIIKDNYRSSLMIHEIHESLAIDESMLVSDDTSSSINIDAMVALAASVNYLSLLTFKSVMDNMKSLRKSTEQIAINYENFKILDKSDNGIPNNFISPGIVNIQSKRKFLSYDQLKSIEGELERKYKVIVHTVDIQGFHPVIRICLPFYLHDTEVKKSLHFINKVFSTY